MVGVSVTAALAFLWLVIPGVFAGLLGWGGRLPWVAAFFGVALAVAYRQSHPRGGWDPPEGLGPLIEQIP